MRYSIGADVSLKRTAIGTFTAKARRAQSKELLINKYSDLCEL